MVKNTKQIALIQHRRGKLSELPKQLNEAEFGLALDTNELFIGNSTNPALAERIDSNTFPYGNIQILTEFTDNLQKIIYRYKSNTDIKARLPIVVKGNVANPRGENNTSVKINGIEVSFLAGETNDLYHIIDNINSTLGPTVKAFTDDGVFLSLITTDSSLTLEDGEKESPTQSPVADLGFGEGSFTAVSSLPPERTLQEVLDDTVSIKSFGAMGDASTTEDGNAIFNAIISINKAGVDPKYYRCIFFPAGTYLSSKVIPLPTGTYLKGEGIQRTIIKAVDLSGSFLMSMDDNMNLSSYTRTYGKTTTPKYITIEDMTIDVSESSVSEIVTLSACKNVVFRNVEFKGSNNSTSIKITDVEGTTPIHICFENCIFNTSNKGIISESNLEHLVIKNCIFENIPSNSIKLEPSANKIILNSIIEGNYFKNCGKVATNNGENNSIIFLGENTQYISVIDNRFDENNSTFEESKAYESLSELNYTDILDPTTDNRKLLQFNFTQPKWQYIDYLLNPNGEYLIKTEYNKEIIGNEEIIKSLTNGIILKQGDEDNNNTFSIMTSSNTGNLNIASGPYGYTNLGDTDDIKYNDWEYGIYCNVEDMVQVEIFSNESYDLYKCKKAITADDYRAGRDVEPHHTDSLYWEYLGNYNPKINIKKPIDLNSNYITDSKDNIVFKTTNNNYLLIDDESNTDTRSYAERIARFNDAIPNVDYVNNMAQTTIRRKINFDTIEEDGKNKQELIYFNPEIYGANISMDSININIRRPFYPVISALPSALEWKSGMRYYTGDVVNALVDNVQEAAFTLKVCDLNTTTNEHYWKEISNVYLPTEGSLDGEGKPLDEYPSYDATEIYAVTLDNSERNVFYKHNRTWYRVGSEEWRGLYTSYAETENEASGNYRRYSKIRITIGENSYIASLDSEPSIENFISDVSAVLPQNSGVRVYLNEENKLVIAQELLDKGIFVIDNEQYDALREIGFEIVDGYNMAKLKTALLSKTYEQSMVLNPSNYILGSVWVQAEGESHYFTCIYDNISSDSFNEDLGENGSIAKWIEVETIDTEGNPLKDLKYLSILAQADDTVDDETGELKENEQRLLFLKNVVEADRRDFHSVYERPFDATHHYVKGDRCLYAGRYWECLEDNTPGQDGAYALHNPELWLAVPEEGFNYHFDFERDLYLIDENDNIVTSDDVVLDYNFSNYHLFLMFYDADQKRLIPYNGDYDLEGMIFKGYVDNISQLDFIVPDDDRDYYIERNIGTIFYWTGDMWDVLQPEPKLCVSPAGNIIITIDYVRG